jgi:hypothetical protein
MSVNMLSVANKISMLSDIIVSVAFFTRFIECYYAECH